MASKRHVNPNTASSKSSPKAGTNNPHQAAPTPFIADARLRTPQSVMQMQRVIGNRAVSRILNHPAPHIQRQWVIRPALTHYYPQFQQMLVRVPGSTDLNQKLAFASGAQNVMVEFDMGQAGPGAAETIFKFRTSTGQLIDLSTYDLNPQQGRTVGTLAQALAGATSFTITVKFYRDQIIEDVAEDAVTLVHELELHFVHHVELIQLAQQGNVQAIRAKLVNDFFQASPYEDEDPDIQHTDLGKLDNYTNTMLRMLDDLRTNAQDWANQNDFNRAQAFRQRADALQVDFIADVFPKYARLNRADYFRNLTGYNNQRIGQALQTKGNQRQAMAAQLQQQANT